jgi:glycosyltransferase involved in cell wall biosynthesis
MQTRLSVILPVLNNKYGFERALGSVLRQNADSIEIIVIDGGSSDGTVDVIRSYQDRISYFETGKDSGIANAFNRGIKNASGEIIATLNSDDAWQETALNDLFATIDENADADIYCGSIEYFDEARDYRYIREPRLSNISRHMPIFHSSMFVRKSCYENIGLYDEKYSHAMDSEWSHRAIAAGCIFCNVPAVLSTMSLGGVSDKEYVTSLRQYRESLIKHKICHAVVAYWFYYQHLLQKRIMRLPFMHGIKRLRDSFITRRP